MLAATTNVATVPGAAATIKPTTEMSGMLNLLSIDKHVKRKRECTGIP